MSDNDSRFDDKLPSTPPPTGLRASNTVESLKPRDISWPTATLPGPGYAGSPADVPPELDPFKTYDPVRKTDSPKLETNGEFYKRTADNLADNLKAAGWPSETPAAHNVLPVNFPASTGLGGKKFEMPSMHDRVTKLEDQVDALLDRIAKHNLRAQHRI